MSPFDPLVEFRSQRMSLAVPEYSRSPPPQHPQWANFDIFHQRDTASGQTLPWITPRGNRVGIDISGAGEGPVPPSLLEAVEHYGRLLKRASLFKPQYLEYSVKGAVAFDQTTGKLYYGASWGGTAWPAGMWNTIDSRMLARENAARQLSVCPPRMCAEFKALSEALLDDASESDLHIWCFGAKDMHPVPRCPNCRITVPSTTIHRIWTG